MSPKDHSIKVRAQSHIQKGEEITIQYLSFMYGHLRRKFTIRDFWFFDCACPRCQDPTEMGSFMSALKCPDCENGNLLTINPMDSQAQWLCSNCQHKQSAESVQDYINYCDDILAENSENFEAETTKYEKLLLEFSQRLHPNHYISNTQSISGTILIFFLSFTVMTIKKFLADLYRARQDKYYEEQIQYYTEFLDVIGKVDPGLPSVSLVVQKLIKGIWCHFHKCVTYTKCLFIYLTSCIFGFSVERPSFI